MYCVETPMYACSLTVPSKRFSACPPKRIFSGRMPMETDPVSVAPGAWTTVPSTSRTRPEPSDRPGRRFETPRKPATKAVCGRS